DKVSMNSSIVRNPELIREASARFGSQAIVAAVDVKRNGDSWEVYVKGGSEPTGIDGLDWCERVEKLGAGEILLTSMDRDGTKSGFDLELLAEVNRRVSIPVIASGGAGTVEHCIAALNQGAADAVLAASIFHFREIGIRDLKNQMDQSGISVRLIDSESEIPPM
ncbi:MAG: HisA/HisF-related TIM barrel protein, partial [Balneolaceae bacterium]